MRRQIKRARVLLLVAGVLAAACADAGRWRLREDSAGNRYLVGTRAGTIRIDGRLDDAGWSHVPTTGPFHPLEPLADPGHRPEIRARWTQDADALYLALTLRETDRTGPGPLPGSIELELGRDGSMRGITTVRISLLGVEIAEGPARATTHDSGGLTGTEPVWWAWARMSGPARSAEPTGCWCLEVRLPWSRLVGGATHLPPGAGEKLAARLHFTPPPGSASVDLCWGPVAVDGASAAGTCGWLEFLDGPLP